MISYTQGELQAIGGPLPKSTPLAWLDPGRVSILYLAKHTPFSTEAAPGLHPETGVTPIYHYEIFNILTSLGFRVEAARSLERLVYGPKDYDYVFSLYNKTSFNDSEVFVSAICEYKGAPYLGARPHMRSLAEDKYLTKLLALHLGISVPDWRIYRRENLVQVPPQFPGPYFVKPRCGAGSMGIDDSSIQDRWCDLFIRIQKILDSGDDAIVEKFIEGNNVTVAILGGDPPLTLPPIQTVSPKTGGVMTRRQKKLLEPTLKRFEYLDPERRGVINEISLKLFNEFHPVDYMRVDFRIPANPEIPPYLLEVNICCNLGSHASMAHAARKVGISQSEMVAQILDYSFRRQNIGG